MELDWLLIAVIVLIGVLFWITHELHHVLNAILIEMKLLREELGQEREKHRDDMKMIRHLLGKIDRSCGSGEL